MLNYNLEIQVMEAANESLKVTNVWYFNMSFILDNYGAQSSLTRWRQSSHDLLRPRYLDSGRQDTGVVSSLINLSLIADFEHKTPDQDFVGGWCEEVTWAQHAWPERPSS